MFWSAEDCLNIKKKICLQEFHDFVCLHHICFCHSRHLFLNFNMFFQFYLFMFIIRMGGACLTYSVAYLGKGNSDDKPVGSRGSSTMVGH